MPQPAVAAARMATSRNLRMGARMGTKRVDDTLKVPGEPARTASGAMMETQDLRKAGLKVTHPRLRILELLETSPGRHFSAEDIYRRLTEHHDDIGLATVYRVLTQFETAGLVLKHNFEGGQAVYEIDRG